MKSIILYIILILLSFLYCQDECEHCKECPCYTKERYNSNLNEYEDYEYCYCSKCEDGYIFGFERCHEPCKESDFLYDCKKCDSNGYSCSECHEGFESFGGTCRKEYLLCETIKREHCNYCKGESDECGGCYSGYSLRNGECIPWGNDSNYLRNKFQKYFIFLFFLYLLLN